MLLTDYPSAFVYLMPAPTPERKTQLKKLWELCEKMGNVPKHRYQDMFWLSENLRIRNSQHPVYEEVMSLLKEMLTDAI